MTYCPNSDENWETLSPRQAGFDQARLTDAIAFAEAHESPWPRDLEKAGDVPGLSQFERPPWNEALGPFKPRGGTNGILLKGGRIVGRWGDPGRVDMTFSIAKSYLAVLAGIGPGRWLDPGSGYGFLWWLNTGKREWPAASESSYAAVGAGTSILWIDPDNDLVLVTRWINQEKVAGLIGHIIGALA